MYKLESRDLLNGPKLAHITRDDLTITYPSREYHHA